jgi:LacI family transcriptional regulator
MRMKTWESPPTRILVQVDLGQKAARDLLGGVLHYAGLHRNWDVRISRGHPMNRIPGILHNWRPHGIITDHPFNPALTAHMSKNGLKGIIALCDHPACRVPLRHVECDNALVGSTGAQFLLSRRLSYFAYVPSVADDEALDRRQNAFVRHIESKGFGVSVYRAVRSRQSRKQTDEERMAKWLAELPKPCGVMAAFDQRAKDVLDACRLAQIDVPSQVMVLGVDNEEYICENTIPTLTSILPDFNGGGLRAAESLDRMIAGETDSVPLRLSYGIKQIVERVSTADVNGAARSVALACEYMRRNAAAAIDIDDIATAAGTSRRLLEKHFRSVLNTTAMHELQRIRLEHVKARLKETDLPIKRIGETCGFGDVSYLMKLFKRTFNVTMQTYRKA